MDQSNVNEFPNPSGRRRGGFLDVFFGILSFSREAWQNSTPYDKGQMISYLFILNSMVAFLAIMGFYAVNKFLMNAGVFSQIYWFFIVPFGVLLFIVDMLINQREDGYYLAFLPRGQLSFADRMRSYSKLIFRILISISLLSVTKVSIEMLILEPEIKAVMAEKAQEKRMAIQARLDARYATISQTLVGPRSSVTAKRSECDKMAQDVASAHAGVYAGKNIGESRRGSPSPVADAAKERLDLCRKDLEALSQGVLSLERQVDAEKVILNKERDLAFAVSEKSYGLLEAGSAAKEVLAKHSSGMVTAFIYLLFFLDLISIVLNSVRRINSYDRQRVLLEGRALVEDKLAEVPLATAYSSAEVSLAKEAKVAMQSVTAAGIARDEEEFRSASHAFGHNERMRTVGRRRGGFFKSQSTTPVSHDGTVVGQNNGNVYEYQEAPVSGGTSNGLDASDADRKKMSANGSGNIGATPPG